MDVIIFAVIAGFILYRLYKVLGSTDHDSLNSKLNQQFYEALRKKIIDAELQAQEQRPIPYPDSYEDLPEPAKEVLKTLSASNLNFNINKFMAAAQRAFEIIINAYASSDKATLKDLLSKKLAEQFLSQLEQFKADGQQLNLTLVGVKSLQYMDAKIENGVALITVKFESEQISFITNIETGELLSGSKTRIKNVTDICTFSKNIESDSKVWLLEEIHAKN